MLARSPRGTSPPSPARSTLSCFSLGTDSPVRAASSHFKEFASMIRQSAGTASPASRITISPGTTSSLFITVSFPSRRTFEVAAVISLSASIAASAFDSCMTPSTALSITTNIIINTSAGFSCSTAAITPDMTAATISIIVIGSQSCFKNLLTTPSCFPSARRFFPCSVSRRSASSAVRPSAPVPRLPRTFSFSSR